MFISLFHFMIYFHFTAEQKLKNQQEMVCVSWWVH